MSIAGFPTDMIFEALDLFADRDRHTIEVLTNYALAHRSESPENFAALMAEHANLEQATLECHRHSSLTAFLVGLVSSQMHYWRIQGCWSLAQQAIGTAIEACHLLGDTRTEATLLGNLALVISSVGDLPSAQSLCQEALRYLDDPQSRAAILHEIGNIAMQQGRLDEAEEIYHQALAIREKLGDASALGHTIHGLC